MEIRIRLEDSEVRAAQAASGIDDPTKLLSHVLREYVRLKATLEIIALGGSDPNAKGPPRRRPPDFENREIEPDA